MAQQKSACLEHVSGPRSILNAEERNAPKSSAGDAKNQVTHTGGHLRHGPALKMDLETP